MPADPPTRGRRCPAQRRSVARCRLRSARGTGRSTESAHDTAKGSFDGYRAARVCLPALLGRRRRAVSRPRRRRVDPLLRGERTASVQRALPRSPGPEDSQDRSLGRSQEHAHPRLGQRTGRARLRHRHLRADGASGATRGLSRQRPASAPSPMSASCPSAMRASMPSTPWAPSSTSTRPSARSRRSRACSSPAAAPSSACRTATIRFCVRCSPRCSRRSGLYAYGYEKSYSRRALRRAARRGGLDGRGRNRDSLHPRMAPDARPGVSFVVPAAREGHRSAACGRSSFLDRHLPAVRRHGYLLATVATKPRASARVDRKCV